jgi:hypothetical protein
MYAEDYQELYSDWKEHLQRTYQESLENISNLITSKKSDQSLRLSGMRFLLGRICELALGRAQIGMPVSSDCDPRQSKAANLRSAADKEFAAGLLEEYTRERFDAIRKTDIIRLKNQLMGLH